jgi:hypothetical protein
MDCDERLEFGVVFSRVTGSGVYLINCLVQCTNDLSISFKLLICLVRILHRLQLGNRNYSFGSL